MKKVTLFACVLAVVGAMAVSAADRDTPEREGSLVALTAGEALDAGVLAGVWTNGSVYAATTTKSLTIIGRVEKETASGATVTLKRGVFRWANGDSTLADKDIGATCYIWTNGSFTVSTAAYSVTCTNAAGKVFDVDSSGVWVRSGY